MPFMILQQIFISGLTAIINCFVRKRTWGEKKETRRVFPDHFHRLRSQTLKSPNSIRRTFKIQLLRISLFSLRVSYYGSILFFFALVPFSECMCAYFALIWFGLEFLLCSSFFLSRALLLVETSRVSVILPLAVMISSLINDRILFIYRYIITLR